MLTRSALSCGAVRKSAGLCTPRPPFIQHVGVDHCGPNVFVAQQFLHGTDVVAGFDQVRGEAVPERVGRDSFCNIRATHGGGNCPTDSQLVQMTPPPHSAARIGPDCSGREDVLPMEFTRRTCKFAF